MSTASVLEEVEARITDACPLLSALGWATDLAVVGWIDAHLDDVESDLSAFHRVDDYTTMPSARFFSLAIRLPAYRGVLNARLQAEAIEEQQGGRSPATPSRRAEKPREVPEAVTFAELEAEGFIRHRRGKVAA